MDRENKRSQCQTKIFLLVEICLPKFEMKSAKSKTFFPILSLLAFGIILSYKLFPHQLEGIGSSIIFAVKRTRPENGGTTNDDSSSENVMTFKCKTEDLTCLRQEKEKLSKMLTNGLISFHPPPSLNVWGHDLLPSEKSFLYKKPLEDPLKAGNDTTSSIEIVGKKNGYRKGENLRVLVTIRNGYGQPTGHGGDHIRIWMVDDEHNASLATEVNDLRNGSYVALLPLAWAGRVTVKASLVYSAAVQRAHYYIRYVTKSTRYLGAGFTSYFSSEITLCSPFRRIPGYSKVCDFTNQNGGMPWFCGMPKDRRLKCRHWTLNFDFDFVNPLPATIAEKQKWSVIKRKYDKKELYPLGSKIHVFVGDKGNERGQASKTLPCENASLRGSWYAKAPRGYFMNKRWIPTTCSLATLTENRITQCLGNTTVLAMGDSNAKKLSEYLVSLTRCVKPDGGKGSWHAPTVCKQIDTGTVIRWRSHALPFHMGSRDATDRSKQKAVHQFIDDIPDEGRFIVIIHLYIHFTAHRDNIFIKHIRAVRESVEKLLQRNPGAKVVIRGPHTFQQFWFTPNGGDIAGPFYTKYIKKAFKGVEDRVLFLQPWDMTVAMENRDLHPPDYVTKAMVNVILGHLCR